VIRVCEVSKRYPGGTVGLDGVTLDVGAGEFVALIGSSGAGKSTLLRCLNGLVTPTAGAICVDGRPVSGASREDLRGVRARVGFVFQTVNLVPFLTARENLLVVDEIGRRTGAAARKRANQLLEELDLTKRRDHLPKALSGGQRQRVAIGRALMNDPALVLFDEPTSSLDTHLGEQVMGLIRSEMKSRGIAAIVVTHDERMTHYADRTVHITDGVLEE